MFARRRPVRAQLDFCIETIRDIRMRPLNPTEFYGVCDIVTDAAMQSTVDISAIRQVLAQHGRLTVDVLTLDEDADLYGAGLTSLATVGIMLALEDRFEVEFPESMLSRGTFRSVSSIAEAVANLTN